eukprot:gene13413-14787_t
MIEEPFRFKAGTRERGQAWDRIATNLNNNKELRFSVHQRGVRERYALRERMFKRKMAAEERESGTNPEPTELDQAIESIIERSEGAEEEIARGDANKRKQAEKEKETAESVRKRSMERLAEMREREIEEGTRKKRRSGEVETVQFLKEKSRKEMEMRKEEWDIKKGEIELRERELSLKEREQEARQKREEDMVYTIMQQQQQLQTIIMQLQQQNQAVIALLANMQK